jgi:hypothetical protein
LKEFRKGLIGKNPKILCLALLILTDLFDISSEIVGVPERFYGPTRTLVVGIEFDESDERCAIFPTGAILKIEIQEIYNGEYEPMILPQDYPQVPGCQNEDSTVSSPYAIVPGTLPTDDELDEWGRQFISVEYSLFPQDLESVLDVFLLKFCSAAGNLPMVSPTTLLFKLRMFLTDKAMLREPYLACGEPEQIYIL